MFLFIDESYNTYVLIPFSVRGDISTFLDNFLQLARDGGDQVLQLPLLSILITHSLTISYFNSSRWEMWQFVNWLFIKAPTFSIGFRPELLPSCLTSILSTGIGWPRLSSLPGDKKKFSSRVCEFLYGTLRRTLWDSGVYNIVREL